MDNECSVQQSETARVLCAVCYAAICSADRRLREGHTTQSEYEKQLARIRDYGIMHGLTAVGINAVFCEAHKYAV